MSFDEEDTMPFHRNWAADDELSLTEMDDWYWSGSDDDAQLPADLG